MKIVILLSLLFVIGCGKDDSGSTGNNDLDTRTRDELNDELNDDQVISDKEVQMINLVNAHRKSKGLVELKGHSETIFQSQSHTKYMAHKLNRLTHNGFSDRIAKIKNEESRNISRSGENIAYNSSVSLAHNALLKSRGHRKNIEGDFTHIGVGIETNSRGRLFVTQIFIKIK